MGLAAIAGHWTCGGLFTPAELSFTKPCAATTRRPCLTPRTRAGNASETPQSPCLYEQPEFSFSVAIPIKTVISSCIAHHAQHFLVVTCPAVLPNQVQEEAFQIQLVDFISLPDSSLRASNGDLTFPGMCRSFLCLTDLAPMLPCICVAQKQGRGHANLKWSTLYRTRTVQETRPVHALLGDPIVLVS
jgi:hypothetical protein